MELGAEENRVVETSRLQVRRKAQKLYMPSSGSAIDDLNSVFEGSVRISVSDRPDSSRAKAGPKFM